MEIHCFAPPPSNVSMNVLTVNTQTVIVIVTTYKLSLYREKKVPPVRVRGKHRKESFKGSKMGVGLFHVGLLSCHGGTDTVLFHERETMNYILCEQVPASPLQVGKSWLVGQSIVKILISNI